MQRITETIDLMAFLSPQVIGDAEVVSSDWVNMQGIVHFLAEIFVGAMVATAVLSIEIEQAKDDEGLDAVTLFAFDNVLAASGADQVYAFETIAERMDTNNGYTHLRLTLTGATEDSNVHAALRGTAHNRRGGDGLYGLIERL